MPRWSVAMMQRLMVLSAVVLAAGACAPALPQADGGEGEGESGEGEGETGEGEGETGEGEGETGEGEGEGELPDDPLRADRLAVTTLVGSKELTGPHATAPLCATCHSNSATSQAMRDAAGRPVAPFDLWQGSMMANAARDPIFRAQLAAEVKRAPAAAAAIEAVCLSCHAPSLTRERADRDAPAPRLADLNGTSDDAHRGLEGVTCVSCHRASPEGLGTDETFDGRYAYGPDDEIYGPYTAPFARPMENFSGFTPTPSSHLRDSALCGSCHTLETHALRPDGTATGGAFLEQSPFLDYRASAFPGEGKTCQSCHMPAVDDDGVAISTRIARQPGGGDFGQTVARSPYGRHVFVGGNALVPQLLRDEAILGASAPAAAFDATIAAARGLLAEAATIEVGPITAVGNDFAVDVTVRSETGHKFPAGYPSRRLVLHVRALDGNGAVLLESGRLDDDGRVVDAAGVPLSSEASGLEPHHAVIDDDGVAQIYEQVPGDAAGAPTTSLLAAEQMVKDNRLLPRGFVAGSADGARVAPVGTDTDVDFVGGADTVRVLVRGARPARVEVELLYQTLGPRWRQGLVDSGTPWAVALDDMLARADTDAIVVASAARQ